MGIYEFRVRRSDRGATPDYAIRRAREIAFADGITVFGDPTVTSKRVPIPIIGPRREFLVTFARATRRAYLPRALHEERDLPDLHRIVDQVDEIR